MPGSPWDPPQRPSGQVSSNYEGSYDEWQMIVARSLTERYLNGDQSMLDNLSGATGPLGQPNRGDFGASKNGAAAATASAQTINFWLGYVKMYGRSDPFLASQFGPPPARAATYIPDPNSTSAVQGSFEQRKAAETEAAARENAAATERARIAAEASKYGADKAAEASRYGTDAQRQSDIMADATARWKAEGDWGVQKYIAELQERGAMERARMEFGMREKELVQRAVEEKNRHAETLQNLALEVAKFDADLAGSPRNWVKYAAWLGNRGIVVNGLTLAMAAQEVPEQAIDPAMVAATSGSPLAGIQTAQEQQSLVSGASGGSTSAQSPFGREIFWNRRDSGGMQAQPIGVEQGGGGGMQIQPIGVTPDARTLDGMDPGQLASQLMGESPFGAPGSADFASGLQRIADATRTTSGPAGSFGGYAGPSRNALGTDIPEVDGGQVDYRKFAQMAKSQQEAKLGGVESVRGTAGLTDWVGELERSRPKGRATGAASYG